MTHPPQARKVSWVPTCRPLARPLPDLEPLGREPSSYARTSDLKAIYRGDSSQASLDPLARKNACRPRRKTNGGAGG